jgi:hypothetical protein
MTPPAILSALTTSFTVADELSNSLTSGNGDSDDLTGSEVPSNLRESSGEAPNSLMRDADAMI